MQEYMERRREQQLDMNWQFVFSCWPERTSTDWLTIISQLTKHRHDHGHCFFMSRQIHLLQKAQFNLWSDDFELIEKDGEPEGQSSRRLLSENLNPTFFGLSPTVYHLHPTGLSFIEIQLHCFPLSSLFMLQSVHAQHAVYSFQWVVGMFFAWKESLFFMHSMNHSRA